VGRRSGAVLDEELLAELLRQPLSDQPSAKVGGAAGGKADDHPHRPCRIGLRECKAREARQRSGAGGELQESTTVMLHVVLPRKLEAKLAEALKRGPRVTSTLPRHSAGRQQMRNERAPRPRQLVP